jgi:DNA-binding FadR family transcriptional regulator
VPIPDFTNTQPPGAAMFAQPMLDQALTAPDRSGHAEAFRPRLERIAAFVAADPANAQQLDELVRARCSRRS